MSIAIYTKISQIREHLKLTRPEFSEMCGVSVNTLKSIEQKGVNPKADILVKIAMCWPEYADWLLTSNVPLSGFAHDLNLKRKYRIIDIVDARFMDKCIVKNNMISEVIFIQSSKDDSDLSAILVADNKTTYQFSNSPNVLGVIWVQSGNMNFDSEHGGKNVLKDFRRYLREIDEDLILNSSLLKLDGHVFDEVENILELSASQLQKVSSREFPYKKFYSWKQGEGY